MDDDTSTAASTTLATTPKERLQLLWGLVLQHCIQYMLTTPPKNIRADYLNAIRAFLKDNGIDADAAHRDDVQTSLKKLESLQLPFNGNPF